MSHQVLLLSVLQSYTSVIIPTSVCSQPNLVSFLITLCFSVLLGEHRTAVGPMTMIMRAEDLCNTSLVCLTAGDVFITSSYV